LIFEWTNATGIVTPAKAGVQEHREKAWIPAFTGMTESVPCFDRPFNHQ